MAPPDRLLEEHQCKTLEEVPEKIYDGGGPAIDFSGKAGEVCF